jgi:hypothetical protein
MIEERDPGPVTAPLSFEARLARSDRSPLITLIVVGAFVTLAIVKPWPDGGPAAPAELAAPGPSSSGSAVVPSGPSAAPSPSPTGEAVMDQCLDPLSWRTATIETWRDQTVRVWRAIVPGPASRPLDPGIPIVPAVGTSVPAIGYCAPTSGPEQPVGPANVRAWSVAGETVVNLELKQIAPVGRVSPYGALFGPPAELGATSSWPNGLVVFRYEETETRRSRWFGIEVSGTTGDRPVAPTPEAAKSGAPVPAGSPAPGAASTPAP